MRLVTKIATKEHRKASSRVELLDLVQDGVFGLVRACEKFDPVRGYSFSTYAYRWIWQTVLVGLNSEERLIKLSSTRLDLIRRYERGEFVPKTKEEQGEVDQLMIMYQFPISLNWVSGGEEPGREIFEQLADPASDVSAALESEADSEAVEVAQVRRALENIPSGQRIALQAEFCLGWFARFENGRKQPTAAARCIRIEQRLREWMRVGEGGPEWSEDGLSKAWIKAWHEEGLVNMRTALETLQGREGR
jgi:RNA polymerase sigma factor (sigma-70 family)